MNLLIVDIDPSPEYRCGHYEQITEEGYNLVFLSVKGKNADSCGKNVFYATSKDINDLVVKAKEISNLFQFSGVMAVDECSVIPTAYIAEAIGLQSIRPKSALKSRNKYLMRQAHLEFGVSIPDFRLVTRKDSMETARSLAGDVGYPVIIKPTLGAASEHVYKVNNDDEFLEYLPLVFNGIEQSCSSNEEVDGIDLGPNEVLIESYLDRKEYALEAYVQDGELFIGSIADRLTLDSNIFDNDLYSTPSSLSAVEIEKIHVIVSNAVKAQGLEACAVHAEVRYHQDVPHIVEIGARIGGGSLFKMAQIAYKYEPVKVACRKALGLHLQTGPSLEKTGLFAVGLTMITSSGEVKKLNVPEQLLQDQDLFNLKLTKSVGDIIKRPPHGNDMLGYIGAKGRSLDSALANAEKLANMIDIEIA